MQEAGHRHGVLAVVAKAAGVVAVALGSIALSLWITPMQQVRAAGQTILVGAAAPSWSLFGPGELDLFGQRIPTTVNFAGPVRPRLALAHITLTEQLNQFAGQGAAAAAHELQRALVHGWGQFFIWQVVVAGLAAIVLFGALAGWLRRGRRRTLVVICVGLVVTEALNVGAIMVTAYTAPAKLSQIDSLQALVGGSPPPAVSDHTAAARTQISKVVVVGDSTAAGEGNRPLIGGSADDKACRRSQDAFAVDLAQANGWQVTNLACGNARIRSGLLQPQLVGDRTMPPQLADPAVAAADLIIVSIGADDVNWSLILHMCAISTDCSNNAEQAYFQQQLAGFSRDLLQLLSQLQLLDNHPVVIVNSYYDPFGGDTSCLAPHGLTNTKKRPLEAHLEALNDILGNGAEAAGFRVARPDFGGHGLCSEQPYIQGLADAAPFHPTASGQLAIALADVHALHQQPGS